MKTVRPQDGMKLCHHSHNEVEAVTSLDPLLNQRFYKSAFYRHVRALAVRLNQVGEYAIQRSHAAISLWVELLKFRLGVDPAEIPV
jgi:hypothetical protein